MFYVAILYASWQIKKVTPYHISSEKYFSLVPLLIDEKAALIKTVNIKQKQNNRDSNYLLESKEEKAFNQITLIDLMGDDCVYIKTRGYLGLWTENGTVSSHHILISNFGLVCSWGDVRNSNIWVSSNTTTGHLAFSKGFDLFVKEPGKKKSHSLKTPFSGCLPLDREPVL